MRSMNNLEPVPRRRSRLILGITLITVTVVWIAALSGVAFNYLAVRHYRALYPPPGQIYTVDGYRMHLYCIGSGSPTLVLESGLGDDFLTWSRVQPELAKVTRVCSYDRPGLGWSEDRPGPRDSNTAAARLHSLLQAADISGPLVLVGHSLGGINVRDFATQFPEAVQGLVFFDSSVPEQLDRLPLSAIKFQRRFYRQMDWVKWKTALGIPRMLSRCGQSANGYEAYANLIKADGCIPSGIAAAKKEFDDFAHSCQEAKRSGPFPQLPILILSQDPNYQDQSIPAKIWADVVPIWILYRKTSNTCLLEAAELSPREAPTISKPTGQSS